jgi:hypothetical protein
MGVELAVVSELFGSLVPSKLVKDEECSCLLRPMKDGMSNWRFLVGAGFSTSRFSMGASFSTCFSSFCWQRSSETLKSKCVSLIPATLFM